MAQSRGRTKRTRRKRTRRKRKGRIKKGYYQGMKLDSGWELAYVLYCQDHGMDIKRNTSKFPYVYRKKARNWIPDFLVDGKWVEIKGRETAKTFVKYAYFTEPLTILRRADLLEVFKYVEEKYGKDFHRLYDKRL